MQLPEWIKLLKGSMDDNGDEPVDLMFDGAIGQNYDEITSTAFASILNAIPKRKSVNLLINTPGGRVDMGTAMFHQIRARGNVNTVVIGMAASMGSILAQAGAVRKMMPGTCMMIHNPMGGVDGEQKDIEAALAGIKVCKENLIDLYHGRTKIGKKKLSDMMDATTIMSAKDALELGFCDEVVSGTSFNNLASIPTLSPEQFLNTFRQITWSNKTVPAVDNNNEQTKGKHMKLLIASLAKLSLIPSADLTDEAAIVTNVETNFGALGITAMRTENTDLKAKLAKFEAAHKARIESKVAKAIEDKLFKAERKDSLISTGLRDEVELDAMITDVQAAKGTAAPAQRRGAPPVPPEDRGGKSETETKIDDLRNELKTADPARQGEIARELRDLRGHKSLFATSAAK